MRTRTLELRNALFLLEKKKALGCKLATFCSTPKIFLTVYTPHRYAEIAKNSIDFIKNIRPTIKGSKKFPRQQRRRAHLEFQ